MPSLVTTEVGDGMSLPIRPLSICFILSLSIVGPKLTRAATLPFELQYPKSGFSNGDEFGTSVAGAGDVDDDGHPDFVVGAPSANNDVGSAYVYSGSTGALIWQNSGSAPVDMFGHSVAGAGDVNHDGFADFIVGAPGAKQGVGAAYVYSGKDNALIYKKEGEFLQDGLGYSVAGAGDVNGDECDDFLIGANAASTLSPGPNHTGSAYLYSGKDGSLIYKVDGPETLDYFGYSVASAGDVNNDKVPDFIVGAPTSTAPGDLQYGGSVYLYSGKDGSLLHRLDGSAAGDFFGISVAGVGNVNGDNHDDFIVGAHGVDATGFSLVGSAYVFSGADWTLLHQFIGAADGDLLGSSVAGAGDVDGHGRADFMVGAPGAGEGPGGFTNLSSGTAYLYSGEDWSLLYQIKSNPSDVSLGTSVAGVEITSTSVAIIAGAPLSFSEGIDPPVYGFGPGSAYVYRLKKIPAIGKPKPKPNVKIVLYHEEKQFPQPSPCLRCPRPALTIRYSLVSPQGITMEVLDQAGKKVKALVEGRKSAGTHSVSWDGTNSRGTVVQRGVYSIRVTTKDGSETKKIIY